MVKYKCIRCGELFEKKNDYIRHIKKKNPCLNLNIISNETRCSECDKTFCNKYNLKRHQLYFCKDKINNTIKSSYNLIDEEHILDIEIDNSNAIKHDNLTPMIIDTSIRKKNSSICKNNTSFNIKSPVIDDFKCMFCQKIFTRQDNLKRHLDKTCTNKNQEKEKENKNQKKEKEEKDIILQKLLAEMKQLKNEMIMLKNNQPNIINNNNTSLNNNSNNSNNILNNNTLINNNINIVAFGKEDLDQLVSDTVCKKILFKGFEAVPQLIEYIHFNEKRPEYHNCYISNLRDKYAIIFDGSNWQVKDIASVIEILRDNKRDFLERKFEDFYDSLDEQTKIKFKRFLNEADTDIVINRYKESLKKLLYNKKNMVIKRRKLKEKEIKNMKLLK